MKEVDTHSFEYFKKMTDCWSKEDLQYRSWEICTECVEKVQEIERLNNIINELEKYMKDVRINNGQIDEWTIMEVQMKLQELKEGK